jgi:hypothetical protein
MPNRISDLVGPRALAGAFGCFLGIAVSGCAVVEDIHGNGTTTRSFVFGAPLNVSTDPTGRPNILKVTGLGLTVSNGATTVGWFDQSKIVLDNDCRVVLVGNTEEQLMRFAGLLHSTNGLCDGSISKGGK